ncbi:hypothetical protein HYW83_03850 [Candidatus Peregrinibacteria bacterium]|nr:hypothetical protein [Candidatus Peregrinibacteria bacterium]
MKKHIHYIILVGPIVLVAVAVLVKVSSAVLLNIRISPDSGSRTICTYKDTSMAENVTAGCDEADTTRIACKGMEDILCSYQGGFQMCIENKGDYNSKEEACGKYAVTIAGEAAPLVSATFESPDESRSICSNMEFTSYNPPNTRSECSGDFAGSYIACSGENDKICKRVDGEGSRNTHYGCTQFESCELLLGKSYPSRPVTEITDTVWVKYDGISGVQLDRKCKKTFITNDEEKRRLTGKTYTTKQACEDASTSTIAVSGDASCTADVWSCGTWNSCSAEGSQTRTCTLTYDCKNTDQPSKPTETKSCTAPEPKPEPEPQSKDQCPRKPDPAKGTGEPAALPAGTEIKAVPSYYLWGCYSQPDKSANASCTAQAVKRTGNATSPCVYGQESIICPAKGTAYKEGNFLKCAPVKLPKNEGKKDDDKTPEPTIITQTVERIVTVEVPSDTSVTRPGVVTAESCKTYKEEVDEKVVAQGDAFLNAADAAFKSTAVNNPAFKKVFYEMLKESAKKSRKLQKLVNAQTCNTESVNEIHSTVKDFEGGELERVKQTLSFIDKEKKVQNQYVGINADFKWIENFAKSLKSDSPQQKLFTEEFKAFELIKIDLQDILNAEKEGKVFGFEVEAIAQQTSELRKNIEGKATAFASKGSTDSKKTVKKAAKKTKKTAKKSSKKKSTKKSTKKTTKKTIEK